MSPETLHVDLIETFLTAGSGVTLHAIVRGGCQPQIMSVVSGNEKVDASTLTVNCFWIIPSNLM
jgi:hypothetical protein